MTLVAVGKILSAIPIYLHNVLHVTGITKKFLSISQLLADNNILIDFCDNVYFVKAKNTRIILLKGIARGGLCQVENLNAVCINSNLSSYVSMSSLSKSFSNSINSIVSTLTQPSSSSLLTSLMFVTSLQFKKNTSMTFVVSSNKSIANIIGHPI